MNLDKVIGLDSVLGRVEFVLGLSLSFIGIIFVFLFFSDSFIATVSGLIFFISFSRALIQLSYVEGYRKAKRQKVTINE